jgi:hypothetical protein
MTEMVDQSIVVAADSGAAAATVAMNVSSAAAAAAGFGNNEEDPPAAANNEYNSCRLLALSGISGLQSSLLCMYKGGLGSRRLPYAGSGV